MEGVIVPLIALYNWDSTIFDGLKVPTAADLNPDIEYISPIPALSNADLRDELLAQIGEMTPLYNQPDVLKHMIATWARTQKPVWVKLWQTTLYKYNPIWNKDGTYSETLTRSGNNSGGNSAKGSNSSNDTLTHGRTDTHSVTGFDTNAFSNSYRDQASGSDINKGSESFSNSGDYSGKYSESQMLTRTEHGNIGVTTTQAMIKEEREAAVFNMYDYIIEAFKKRFCLLIY